MKVIDNAIRVEQIAEMLSVSVYHHLFKLMGNIIDEEDGVIEQHISQLLARRLLDRLRMNVEVGGGENVPVGETYCVISNHASYLDWAVLLGYFPSPLRFIAKRELIWMPVIGSYLKLRGVLIDRKSGMDAKRAIKAAVNDHLPWPILLFAEGTRTFDGGIQPFKRGGLAILAEAGVTMVPVRIQGTFDAFPRQATYIRRGKRLGLFIGEPIRAADGDPEWMMEEVERRVRALGR